MDGEGTMNDVAVGRWYARKDVQFELAKAGAYREAVAIKHVPDRKPIVIRPFQFFYDSHVRFWMERLQPWNVPIDFYQSVVTVKLGILPNTMPEMREVRETLLEEWSGRITAYNLFADIDVMDKEAGFGAARDAAVRLTDAIRELHRLPAYPVFSGTGWNVRSHRAPEGGVEACARVVREAAAAFDLPFCSGREARSRGLPFWVDSTVYDARRIWRVPFTVNTKSRCIVTPLTVDEARNALLAHFNVDDYAFGVRDRLKRVQESAYAAVLV
jgi:hypothetical protein